MSETEPQNGIWVIPRPAEDLSPDKIKSYSYKSSKGEVITVPYFPSYEIFRFFRDTFGIGVNIVDRKEKSGIVFIELPAMGSRPSQRIYSYIRAFTLEYFTYEDGKKVPHVIDFEGAAVIDKGNVAKASHAAASNAYKELIKMFGFGLSVFEQYESSDFEEEIDVPLKDIQMEVKGF